MDADPFRAIADPTRRRILDLLLDRGSLTVGELAHEFPSLVASGISKHLMTLRAAGLVTATKQGRHQRYVIDREGFRAVIGPWVASYESYWSTALRRLHELVTGPVMEAPVRGGDDGPSVDIEFVTSAKFDDVWAHFTDPELLSRWHGHAELFEPWVGGRVRFADPGWEPVDGMVEVLEPQRRIEWRAAADASRIIETFEAHADGTRVRVQQHGLTHGWPPDGLADRVRGWEESIADLVLLLDHGVQAARHKARRGDAGLKVAQGTAGLSIDVVEPGGPADAAGLERGDVLLSIDGVAIYKRVDYGLVMRSRPRGAAVILRFVRHREIGEATVTLQ